MVLQEAETVEMQDARNMDRVWYDRDAFETLSISELNTLDPFTARVDIAVPLYDGAEGMAHTSTETINGQRYGVFRVEFYRVGQVNYVQGYKDFESGQDIPLTSLFEWLGHGETDAEVEERVGITRIVKKNGKKNVKAAPAATPLIERGLEGSVVFHLQSPDYLIEPARIQEAFETSRTYEPTHAAGVLGKRLFIKYGKDYLDRMTTGAYGWSHQPAISVATGLALMDHSRAQPKEGYRGWVSSPTGSGKTEVQSALIEEALSLDIPQIIYVTSRTLLVNQTNRRFIDRFGKEIVSRFDQNDKNTDGRIILTTFQSALQLFSRLRKEKKPIPLVLWDEGHNLLLQRRRLGNHPTLRNSIQLAYTATPGIGFTLSDLGYEEILTVPLAYTIETGVTPPIAVKRTILRLAEGLEAAKKKSKKGEINELEIELELSIRAKIENFLEESVFVDNDTVTIRPTFIEVDSIEEGGIVYEQIRAVLTKRYGKAIADQVGFIHSQQSQKKNEDLIHKAVSGEVTVLLGVDMISEGLDIPTYEVIILKPWKRSEFRPFQDMGRVMRMSRTGNPCLVVEIWPFEDADIKGYKSALQIMGVSFGDARVAFRSKKQYEREVLAYEELRQHFHLLNGEGKAYYAPYQFIIKAVREKRNRVLVGVSEFEQISSLVIPKYRAYLAGGGEPILAARFSDRDDSIRLYPNAERFEEIAGFRWWLLPYFRLEKDQIGELARLMYDEEVRAGKRKPLETLGTARSFHQYVRDVVTESKMSWGMERDQLEKILAQAFARDFAIASMAYTVNGLAQSFIPSNDGEKKMSLSYFLDLLRVIGTLESTPLTLPYLKPQKMSMQTPASELLGFVRGAVERRVRDILGKLDDEMKGYVHAGAGIDSDLIYQRHRSELEAINQFVERVLRVSTALRFGTSLLAPSQRGRPIVSDVYLTMRSGYPVHGYTQAGEDQLVELLAARLRLHKITEAEHVPDLQDPHFDVVFGMPRRAFDTMCDKRSFPAATIISRAARIVDSEYERSHELFRAHKNAQVVANGIAEALVEAGVPLPEIEELTMDSLLLVKRKKRFVLPRIFVDVPYLKRGDGRTRQSFKGYAQDILATEPSKFLSMIKMAAAKMQ